MAQRLVHTFHFLVAWGSRVWILGEDMAPLGKSHAVVGIPHIKWRRIGTMLAQGQSSSAKRGRLAVVSSGLIFFKNKKKRRV